MLAPSVRFARTNPPPGPARASAGEARLPSRVLPQTGTEKPSQLRRSQLTSTTRDKEAAYRRTDRMTFVRFVARRLRQD